MASQDQYPKQKTVVVAGEGPRPSQRLDPTAATSGSRAMWSALVALVIVLAMFGVFYDLSGRRDQTAAGGPAATAPQTTGQSTGQR